MVIQRMVSGVAWIALAAAGLYLLQPSLFPDVQLPMALAAAISSLWAADPHHLVGLMVTLVAAAIGVSAVRGAFARRPRAAPVHPGPQLGGPEPSAPLPKTPHAAATAAAPPQAEPEAAPAVPIGSAPPVRPERLVALPPTPPLSRYALLSHLKIGDEARDRGRAEQAGEHYSTGVQIARGIQASAPDSSVAKADLACALARLAGQEEAEGRIDPALALYEEAVELRRNLAAAAPGDADAAQALAGALSLLADCREARGHTSRAKDIYTEAVGITERLSWLEPESEPRREALAAAKARLAALQAELSVSEPS